MGDKDSAKIAGWLLGMFIGALAGGACCICCSCRCCCRRCRAVPGSRATPSVRVGGVAVPVEHLRRKKELGAAYLLWCSAGLVGAHHFYLGRVLHGALASWSMNFLGVGWAVDALLLPAYTRGANSQAAGAAPSDGSTSRACCRFPCVLLFALVVVLSVVARAPLALQEAGALDIERAIAKTQQNPYDTLGVPRGGGASVAKQAYQEQMRALTSKACDAHCKAKKKELGKAMAFINGSAWRRPLNKTSRPAARDADDEAWNDWSDFVQAEWSGIMDVVKTNLEGLRRREDRGKGKGKDDL